MDIVVDNKDNCCVLHCKGRLDGITSVNMEAHMNNLVKDGQNNIVVDGEHISYLSSTGMRLLFSFTKKLKQNGGRLILFGLSEYVMSVIQLAGMDYDFLIFDSEKEAISHFQ